MEDNIKKFLDDFKRIKAKKLNKSLRTGYTGIGYTYETLIGKKEDNKYFPDINGIEIKTKLGYSKSNLTLFTLVPQSKNGIKYLYNKYGYERCHGNNGKIFRCDVYSDRNVLIQNKYIMRLKIDRNNKIIRLIILNCCYEKIDDSIYWNFDVLKERLETKLNILAIIKGYPYKRDNVKNYKYTNISIYKLKNFETFIKMIESNKIYITFNISTRLETKKHGQVYDRGTAFKIRNNFIDDLFEKIY